MPLLRALRRVCIFASSVYVVFCFFVRWHMVKRPGEVMQLDTMASKLRNAVDRALDEAVSDIVLSDNAFRTGPSSRQDLKRILETQEILSRLDQPGNNDTLCSNAPSKYAKVCRLLSGKRILLVGPETTFFLHDLWLESQEQHEHSADACFGRDYCTFHHICRAYPGSPPSSSSSDAEPFAIQMVGRKKKMPSKAALRASGASILQYAMSSTLHTARDAHDAGYTRPPAMVDARTGVRMPNTHWLGRARKADVVVFSRAPVPAPVWTYTVLGSSFGNWTFAQALCAERDLLDMGGGCVDLLTCLTNAALHATLDTFLPSVLAFLKDGAAVNAESVLLWHGSWFIDPRCASRGAPLSMKEFTLLHDPWSTSYGHHSAVDDKGPAVDKASLGQKTDPWSFYYNAQVYMHERILPKILPHFNITYVSLAVPTVGGTGLSNNDGTLDEEQTQYSPLRPKNCIRSPWPGFGANLEEMFKSKLMVALQHTT